MHFECLMGVNPDPQPPCSLFVEPDDAFTHFDFRCEFCLGVLLVVYPGCIGRCFYLCSVERNVLLACSLDAVCCPGFEFRDHLVHVRLKCTTSKVI